MKEVQSSWKVNLLELINYFNSIRGIYGKHVRRSYSAQYSYDFVYNIFYLTRYDSAGSLLDFLVYEYYNLSRNNRLKRIVDAVNTPIPIDLETQPSNDYLYDAVGNMTEDKSQNMQVFYTYSNKLKRINLGCQTIRMLYNPSGYRFFKGKGPNKGQIFVYNSQGQLMAKYTINGRKLKLDFIPIYEGTRRLGILEPSGVLWIDCPPPRLCFEEDSLGFVQLLVPSSGSEGGVLKAERKYELTDHLGNVRVVIRDQRVPVSTNGTTVAYYKPLVDELSDYYPYGWQKILGRYQFGANAGSLFEDWDSTRGTYYTLYRLLDARIARWYQVEPLWESYAWMSPYVVNGGNPVMYIDILGDSIRFLNAKAAKIFIEVTNELYGEENNPFYIKNGKLFVDPNKVKGLKMNELQKITYDRISQLIAQVGWIDVIVASKDDSVSVKARVYVDDETGVEMGNMIEKIKYDPKNPHEGLTVLAFVRKGLIYSTVVVFTNPTIYNEETKKEEVPAVRIYEGPTLLHELLIHNWIPYVEGVPGDQNQHHKQSRRLDNMIWRFSRTILARELKREKEKRREERKKRRAERRAKRRAAKQNKRRNQ